ncbi:PREDICTED: glutamate synthase [NADPH] large chain-like, partial [Priapulus caudatus]|uniref:Glutamate synthase [NADPH] large chain-like n=1 Tax=Priapulus caudatus TaxID=37621 RepID=A0ABM1F7V0_PRICU
TKLVDEYFKGTATSIEGIGIKELAEESVRWHEDAFGDKQVYKKHLDVGGDYAYRIRGESHVWNPNTIAKLQHAVRANNAKTFGEFSQLVDEQNENLLTLRGLMELKLADKALPIDEVESVAEIVKRFSTGAMSFGSISYEAHSTLAVAMNQIGGKSNTGEGGEEASRFMPLADGSMNPERSAIKQIASGRFGVTAEYLVNAD